MPGQVARARTTSGSRSRTRRSACCSRRSTRSIVLIAMPAIFRGIHLDPLQPGNSFYLLWMILGFLVVSSVLVVSLGRLGDSTGACGCTTSASSIYTLASLLLDDRLAARARRRRLADRLPDRAGDRRRVPGRRTRPRSSPTRSPRTSAGWRSGSTTSSGISGMFIGLVLGGVLAPIDWRLDLPRLRAVRASSGRSGRTEACARSACRSRDPIDWRGQPHVRRGARARDGRDHVRDPAVRRAIRWAGRVPFVDALPRARRRCCSRVRRRRAARRRQPMFRLQLFRSARSRSACSRASSRRSRAAA